MYNDYNSSPVKNGSLNTIICSITYNPNLQVFHNIVVRQNKQSKVLHGENDIKSSLQFDPYRILKNDIAQFLH